MTGVLTEGNNSLAIWLLRPVAHSKRQGQGGCGSWLV